MCLGQKIIFLPPVIELSNSSILSLARLVWSGQCFVGWGSAGGTHEPACIGGRLVGVYGVAMSDKDPVRAKIVAVERHTQTHTHRERGEEV